MADTLAGIDTQQAGNAGQTTGKNPGLVNITVTIPRGELAELDQAAAEAHISRSLALREGAKLWLKNRKRA